MFKKKDRILIHFGWIKNFQKGVFIYIQIRFQSLYMQGGLKGGGIKARDESVKKTTESQVT